MWDCPEFMVQDIIPFAPNEQIKQDLYYHKENFSDLIYKETVEVIFKDYPDILQQILNRNFK